MKWYVTFGSKYRYEEHPTLGHRPDLPDGYLTVEADSRAEATRQVVDLIDIYYCSLYPMGPDDGRRHYPLGDLGPLADAVAAAKSDEREQAADDAADLARKVRLEES